MSTLSARYYLGMQHRVSARICAAVVLSEYRSYCVGVRQPRVRLQYRRDFADQYSSIVLFWLPRAKLYIVERQLRARSSMDDSGKLDTLIASVRFVIP